MANAWKATTHRRGARHASKTTTNGFTVGDLWEFANAVEEAKVSDDAVIRIDQSNLSESGRRTVTLSVDEQYEPPVSGPVDPTKEDKNND